MANARRQAGHRSVRTAVCTAAAACALALGATGCGSGVLNALPSAIPAAKGVPSGPVLGYIFSATDGTLRPMLGVRGSAQVGASVVPAGVYVAGEASTAGATALLEDGSGSLLSFNLPASQPTHVLDHLAGRAQVAFASSGHTAVVFVAGSGTVSLVTGLPGSPAVKTLAVPSGITVESAAVSDAGTVVVQAGTAIGRLSASGQVQTLATISAAGGMSFIAASDDLLFADQSANTISVVRNVSSAPALQVLSAAGINQPVAVSASLDKHWAVVANGGDQSLLRVDLTAAGATTKLACACAPTQLSALAGGAGFRVNALGSGPVWTLDVSGSNAQMLFVPAIP